MPKFKVGQEVICIGKNTGAKDNNNPGYGGWGWKKGFKFKIIDIIAPTSNGRTCYWAGYDGNGVYENHLELVVNDWDK